ncbi:hypothetical protein B0H14DRAFT_2628539 [Mycena olivaceomarginata]|nr:hypothetical protein B0H14DRAFT_2628539 [Mycena olivaceomarginata]
MTPAHHVKGELTKDARNVTDLWNVALKKYQSIVGVPAGVAQINNFHQFRHNQKKVDTICTLFKANMDSIIQCAQQLLAAVAPAFPPAMAIGAALTYISLFALQPLEPSDGCFALRKQMANG